MATVCSATQRDRLGLLRREEGRIHGEQDLLAGGLRGVRLGLRPEFGAAAQVGRAAEIGNELGEDQPLGVAVEDAGVVEGADGAEPRVLVGRADRHDIGGESGIERRLDLPGYLPRRQGPQVGDADLRMVAERRLMGLLQCQWRSVGCRSGGREREAKQKAPG